MLFLLILLLNANLFATTYSSNAIGQKIAPIEALVGSGYEVEEDGNVTTLYLDGKTLEQTIIQDDVKTIRRGDRVESIKTEDGHIVYRSVQDGDEQSETFYEWDDDSLLRKRNVKNGEMESIITYIMDNEVLLGYQEVLLDDKKLTFINQKRLGYTLEDSLKGEVINHYDNLIFKSEFSSSEEIKAPVIEEKEDKIILTDVKGDESTKTTYEKSGLIVEKEKKVNDDVVKHTSYSYDDERAIKEEVTEEGDKKIVSSYSGGKLEKVTTYLNDELFSIRYYDAEIYEIRYKNGKPFARLLYDEDGKSLLELKIL